jgi:hypothetical protein
LSRIFRIRPQDEPPPPVDPETTTEAEASPKAAG